MSSNAPLLETTSFTTTPASSPEAAPAAAESVAATPNGGIPQPPTTAEQPPSAPETSSAATEPSSTTTTPSSTTTATTTTTRLHPIIVNASSSSSSSNSTASPKPVVTKPRIVKTVRFDLTFEQDDEDPSKTGIAEIRQVVVNADGDTTPPGTIHTFFNPLNLLQQPPPPPPMRDSEPNSKKWTHGGVVVLMGAIAVAIMVMFYAKTNGDQSNDANKGLDVRASINDSSLFNSDIQDRINVGQDGYLRMRPSLDGRAIAPRSKGVNHMIQELLYIWTTYEHQDDAVDCPPIMMPRADHPCRFEMPLLGDSCRPENGFGYLDYKPCFFLDLVQTGQWIPGPYYKGYSSETKTPLWAPVNCYLWVRSKKGAPLQQGYLSSVWPSFGVPRWFFPASASTNFYSPLVAIQLDLTDLPPNSDFVTLMCQIMASNGRLLAADATWATMSVAEIVKEQINKKANDAKKKEELAARLGGNTTSTTEATAQAEALRGEPRGLSGKSFPWDKNGALKKFSSFS